MTAENAFRDFSLKNVQAYLKKCTSFLLPTPNLLQDLLTVWSYKLLSDS